MFRRVLFPLFGCALIAGVVWLGLRSASDSRYIVWFGLASAIAAPLGLAAISQLFRARDADILRRLSRVPELQSLIEQATSAEEKLRLLEQERQQLEEIIACEAVRRALADRRERLAQDGRLVLDELRVVDAAAKEMEVEPGSAAAAAVLSELKERLQAEREGYAVFRLFGRQVAIKADSLGVPGLPMLPFAVQMLARSIGKLQRRKDRL